MSSNVLKLDLNSARLNAKAGEHRGLDVTISVRYHWPVARQLTPFHYVIGIS